MIRSSWRMVNDFLILCDTSLTYTHMLFLSRRKCKTHKVLFLVLVQVHFVKFFLVMHLEMFMIFYTFSPLTTDRDIVGLHA